LVAAAEVSESAKSSTQVDDLRGLLGKAKHLAAIHSADRRAWPSLAKRLLGDEGWSVSDTENAVAGVKEFKISKTWEEIFLPYEQVIEHHLSTREFLATTVAQLIAKADDTINLIKSYKDKVNVQHYKEKFEIWLKAGTGSHSWDVRKLAEYYRELAAELEGQAQENHWLLGDWREHVEKLKDGSVAAVVTDPPYGIDYQSDHRLDRTRERKHDKLKNDQESAPDELKAALESLLPKLRSDAHVFVFCHWSNEPEIRERIEAIGLKIRGRLIWSKNNTGMGDTKTTFAPKHEGIIHAVKGSPILFHREPDVLEADRVKSDRHPTEKPVELLKRLIEITTVKGDLISDPFGGVASTAAAAAQSGRCYWSCETKKDFWTVGKERLATA
jgi:site-specific DNA-methyltransferase (adenine-specific)